MNDPRHEAFVAAVLEAHGRPRPLAKDRRLGRVQKRIVEALRGASTPASWPRHDLDDTLDPLLPTMRRKDLEIAVYGLDPLWRHVRQLWKSLERLEARGIVAIGWLREGSPFTRPTSGLRKGWRYRERERRAVLAVQLRLPASSPGLN